MVTLTLEGSIVQEGSNLRMSQETLDVPSVADAMEVVEARLGRPLENWDALVVLGNTVWAVV